MTGLIGMSCGETARFSEPYDSLMNLERPEGWAFRQARSMSIAENWNYIVEQVFLPSEAEWLFLVNDDHVYPMNALLQLLARDVDVVTGLYLNRQSPFIPVIGASVDAAGGINPAYLGRGDRGLMKVQACGDGCLLLRRKVLEAIEHPRWQLGVYRSDAVDHDNAFCAKVRDAGFTIWCDLEVTVGHLAVLPIFPHRDEHGVWHTAIVAGSSRDHVLTVPQARSPISIE